LLPTQQSSSDAIGTNTATCSLVRLQDLPATSVATTGGKNHSHRQTDEALVTGRTRHGECPLSDLEPPEQPEDKDKIGRKDGPLDPYGGRVRQRGIESANEGDLPQAKANASNREKPLIPAAANHCSGLKLSESCSSPPRRALRVRIRSEGRRHREFV